MARNPQREDRRRRVLRDESRSAKKTTKRRTASSDRAYGEQALRQNQPRLTDCLPLRGMSLFYLFALGIAAIGGVQSLHVAREAYLLEHHQIDTSWLALTGPMTISSYLAASLLTMTAIISLVVFHIRRHKIDDYKGRYRMWYVVVAALALASVDVITHAHRGVRDVLILFVEEAPWQNPAMWWILIWSVVGGLVGLRALVEVRRSKSTVFTWLLAIGCMVGSALLYLRVFEISAPQTHLMARSALFLAGLHLLMFGTALYARYVYLEAQGAKRTKKSSASGVKSGDGDEKRTGLFKLPGFRRGSREKPKPRKQKKKAAASAKYVEAYDEDDEDAYEYDDYEQEADADEPTEAELELLTNPDLTRAERRKLKKQMKRRRSAA